MKVTPGMLLFLAGKMGHAAHNFCGDIFISNESGDEAYQFRPHTDKAQFADVVLWAAVNQLGAAFVYGGVFCREHSSPHDNTPAGIMEATVVAVCRALGWEDV